MWVIFDLTLIHRSTVKSFNTLSTNVNILKVVFNFYWSMNICWRYFEFPWSSIENTGISFVIKHTLICVDYKNFKSYDSALGENIVNFLCGTTILLKHAERKKKVRNEYKKGRHRPSKYSFYFEREERQVISPWPSDMLNTYLIKVKTFMGRFNKIKWVYI